MAKPLDTMSQHRFLVLSWALIAAVPPMHAQTPARGTADDTIPVLFGEGVLSTGDNEFSIAFSRDNRTVYWTVSAPNVFVIPFVILMSTRDQRGWETPQVAPFSGTGFSDADPATSRDGTKIYFMSRRPADGSAQKPDFDIWVYEDATQRLARIDEVNSESMDLFPSVTADGTLYFASDRDGGFGAADIYRSRFVNGRYLPPENIGGVVNSAQPEANVYVAPDESYLLFSASGRKDGKGGVDLYIAERSANGEWTAPRPLKYVNSEWDDYAPTVSHDGTVLYFTSRRPHLRPRPTARLTFDEVRARFRAPGNGNADIYSISFQLAASRTAK
jgi:Tol biopolymer transport system component